MKRILSTLSTHVCESPPTLMRNTSFKNLQRKSPAAQAYWSSVPPEMHTIASMLQRSSGSWQLLLSCLRIDEMAATSCRHCRCHLLWAVITASLEMRNLTLLPKKVDKYYSRLKKLGMLVVFGLTWRFIVPLFWWLTVLTTLKFPESSASVSRR